MGTAGRWSTHLSSKPGPGGDQSRRSPAWCGPTCCAGTHSAASPRGSWGSAAREQNTHAQCIHASEHSSCPMWQNVIHFHGSLRHTNGLLGDGIRSHPHDQFDYIRVLPEISVSGRGEADSEHEIRHSHPLESLSAACLGKWNSWTYRPIDKNGHLGEQKASGYMPISRKKILPE